MTFRYFMTFLREEPERPRGLFMFNREGDRYDTVAWDHVTRRWEHAPDPVGRYLFGESYQDERVEIGRERAEEIARAFGTEVPSEAELMAIGDRAERLRASRSAGGQ